MYMKHGKVKFGHKDTFNVSETLRPIIGDLLLKYAEAEANAGEWRHAAPISFVEDVTGKTTEFVTNTEGFMVRDVDEEFMSELWEECVAKMVFAFTSTKPNRNDYNYGMNISENEETDYFTFTCTGEEEAARHTLDMKVWLDKVQEGQELFGKYLSSLWW